MCLSPTREDWLRYSWRQQRTDGSHHCELSAYASSVAVPAGLPIPGFQHRWQAEASFASC
eukprot:3988812-Amphidinium_carterae.1